MSKQIYDFCNSLYKQVSNFGFTFSKLPIQTEVIYVTAITTLFIDRVYGRKEGLKLVCKWIEDECFKAGFYDGDAKLWEVKSYPMNSNSNEYIGKGRFGNKLFNVKECYQILEERNTLFHSYPEEC